MPPQLQALLQNRNALIGIVAVVILVIVLAIAIPLFMGGGKPADPGDKKLEPSQQQLMQGAPAGKVMEVQAILARQGIRTDTSPGVGGTLNLSLMDGATLNERDTAVITMVESGLVDGNAGLEMFDDANLMESREEKRIKLIRAQQGELSRLIRKINPVEDAKVNLSIPEPTIFSKEQKPMSASVQVTLQPGDRLTRDKVRAIINLMVGAVQGLEAKNVALADTNGNTYNSVLDSGMELQDKMEEQDRYMREKIASQLEKLVGAGNYVVTVSTSLREAPRETLVQSFDPSRSALNTKQRFSETLSTGAGGAEETGGPVSSMLPVELEDVADDTLGVVERKGKGYLRDGVEMTYQNGKTQWVETSVPGMIEDISIAVTIDTTHFPNMPIGELQALIARAANPKVNPTNVSIARADFANLDAVTEVGDATDPLEEPANPLLTWLPWMIVSLGVGAVILALTLAANRAKSSEDNLNQTTQEIEALRQTAQHHQEALAQQQQQAQQLLQAQQQEAMRNQQALLESRQQDTTQLQQALNELKVALEDKSTELGPDGLEAPIKSWIES